jgi:hypothetical protein
MEILRTDRQRHLFGLVEAYHAIVYYAEEFSSVRGRRTEGVAYRPLP